MGFQFQPKGQTVQGELFRVFRSLLKDNFKMRAAGRTDRGVHAIGMVISVRSEASFNYPRLLELVNDRLCPYVRLSNEKTRDWDFHPRFGALMRHYRYVICDDISLQGPTMHAYTAFTDQALDWAAIEAGARYLEGTRSFLSFCKHPSDQPRLVRRIDRISFSHQGSFHFVDFWAPSFLRGQIRNIMGWLIAVGLGDHPPSVINDLLAKEIKDVAVKPAPPEGLYLIRIWYPGDVMPGWWTAPAAAAAVDEDDE